MVPAYVKTTTRSRLPCVYLLNLSKWSVLLLEFRNGSTNGEHMQLFQLLICPSRFQINFDCDSRDFDYNECMDFWDSMGPWFLERGYTLYRQDYEYDDIGQYTEMTYPVKKFDRDVRYPYSYCGGDRQDSGIRPLRALSHVCLVSATDDNCSHILSGSYRFCTRLRRSSYRYEIG